MGAGGGGVQGLGLGAIPACGGQGMHSKKLTDVLKGEGGGAYQTFPVVVCGLPGTLLWVHLGVGVGVGVRVRVRVLVMVGVRVRLTVLG